MARQCIAVKAKIEVVLEAAALKEGSAEGDALLEKEGRVGEASMVD